MNDLINYWPQFTYLFLLALGLGISLEKHGKPKVGEENAWTTIIGTAIVLTLLYCGGFFDGVTK